MSAGIAVEANEYVREWGRSALEHGLYVWGFDAHLILFGLLHPIQVLADPRSRHAMRTCPVSCSLLYDLVRDNSAGTVFARVARELKRG